MENISFLIDYHVWAHNKVLHQLQTVTAGEWNKDLGGSFPSLHQLCKHLVSADYRWLQRWKGVPLANIPDTFVFESYTQVNAVWQPILEEMKTVSNHFFETGVNQPLSFTTAKGDAYSMPFWQTLYQVVNHGTYHRGQITNMLRMLNRQPVGTDILLFFAEKV
jgi:uncharacterized damage-inducible protein DinB